MNLTLPFLAAGQAQKHVTVNEALRMLDVLVQLAVVTRALSVPPASPAEGAAYIIATDGAGNWNRHGGKVAAWQDGGWIILVPREGGSPGFATKISSMPLTARPRLRTY